MTDNSVKRKNYFHRELFVLKVLGISLKEQESLVYKIYSFFVRYFIAMSYPFLAFGDLNKHGFDVFAQSFTAFLATVLGNIGSITLYRNRIRLGKFLNRLQKAPFLANRERGGDKEEKMIDNWVLSTKKQVIPLYVAISLSYSFVYLYTIINRLRSSDPQDWIFVLGPLTLLDVTRSPNFEISVLYQLIALTYIGTTMCTTIFILSEILAYICVQFQMLQNNLKVLTTNYRIKDANTSNTSEIPWKYLKIAVKDVVSYHLNILEVVSKVDAIFSVYMLLMYFIILCILCFDMYAASVISFRDPRVIVFLCEASIGFCLPLIICYWGEQVAYESQQVARAAYEINFVGSDIRFQKALNLIVMRSQSAARIKAGRFVETSLETFTWIVRSSFSYLMIVIKLNTHE